MAYLQALGIPAIDFVALAWFAICWIGYTRYADYNYTRKVNLMHTMDGMRMRWMQEVMTRDNRMVDATLVGNLLRAIAFFASTTILILIGLFTVLGSHTQAQKLIENVPFADGTSPFMWEVKIILLCLIFIYAFFKLTWSLRQYNYICILVGAAPKPQEYTKEQQQEHNEYARRAGLLSANAGRHFNMGLRAYYYGLAAVCWFINAGSFMLATTFFVLIIYRREFRSHAVNHIRGMELV
jgi:uncharacterized membrane protein